MSWRARLPELAALARRFFDAHVHKTLVFPADVTELSVVRLGEPAGHLVIESWHPGRGVTRTERR